MLRHFPANRAAPYGFTGHCIGGVKAGLLVYVSRPVPSGGFGVKHLTVSRRVNCEVVVGTANNGLASANADMLQVAKVIKWAHWAVASMRCANHASARKPIQCRHVHTRRRKQAITRANFDDYRLRGFDMAQGRLNYCRS